jgi:hypothetical protein
VVALFGAFSQGRESGRAGTGACPYKIRDLCAHLTQRLNVSINSEPSPFGDGSFLQENWLTLFLGGNLFSLCMFAGHGNPVGMKIYPIVALSTRRKIFRPAVSHVRQCRSRQPRSMRLSLVGGMGSILLSGAACWIVRAKDFSPLRPARTSGETTAWGVAASKMSTFCEPSRKIAGFA